MNNYNKDGYDSPAINIGASYKGPNIRPRNGPNINLRLNDNRIHGHRHGKGLFLTAEGNRSAGMINLDEDAAPPLPVDTSSDSSFGNDDYLQRCIAESLSPRKVSKEKTKTEKSRNDSDG